MKGILLKLKINKSESKTEENKVNKENKENQEISKNVNLEEYYKNVQDIISHEKFTMMDEFIQHGNITCLEHCLYVSYVSFRVSKFFRFNKRETARAGLLHDFFLYDWHGEKPYDGLHGFYHAGIALENARKYFHLNDIEEDIIGKHMWPLNLSLPKYKESVVVILSDRYCTLMEVFKIAKLYKKLRKVLFSPE